MLTRNLAARTYSGSQISIRGCEISMHHQAVLGFALRALTQDQIQLGGQANAAT